MYEIYIYQAFFNSFILMQVLFRADLKCRCSLNRVSTPQNHTAFCSISDLFPPKNILRLSLNTKYFYKNFNFTNFINCSSWNNENMSSENLLGAILGCWYFKTRMTTSISSEALWNYIKDIWKIISKIKKKNHKTFHHI